MKFHHLLLLGLLLTPHLHSEGPEIYKIDSEIEPYIETFKEKMLLAGIEKPIANLEAHFSLELNDGEAGRCSLITTRRGPKEVVRPILRISATFWDQMPEPDREELVYHELAHCILGRKEHVTLTENGIPVSILHPSHLGSDLYIQYYGEYMAELFSDPSPELRELEFNYQVYP